MPQPASWSSAPVLAENPIRYAIEGACGKLTRDDSVRPICDWAVAIFTAPREGKNTVVPRDLIVICRGAREKSRINLDPLMRILLCGLTASVSKIDF